MHFMEKVFYIIKLGHSLRMQNKLEESIIEYDQALLINPNSANALYGKGVLFYIKLGETLRLLNKLNESCDLLIQAI